MNIELVTIGDELLRGWTINSNAAWLGRELSERGARVSRTTVVPDDVEEIASVVVAASERADAVITTGGLGPTHDDRTMAAIALAFEVELVEHQEAAAWIDRETKYSVADLAPGTLDLPTGAGFIPNEVGLAPGAIIENVYVLPGIPEEMEAMFGRIADTFAGLPIHEAIIEVAQPEREIAPILTEALERFDLSIGSYPGRTVRVRLLGRDEDEVETAATWLRDRLELA